MKPKPAGHCPASVDSRGSGGGAGERHDRRQPAITAGRAILVGGKPERCEKRGSVALPFFGGDNLLAVVEAESKDRPAVGGLRQAKDKARVVGLHFADATNGTEIIEFDAFTGQETTVPAFPSPAELVPRDRTDYALAGRDARPSGARTSTA